MIKRAIEERFFEKVEMIPFHTCWEWVGCKNNKGYGGIQFNGEKVAAHIISLMIHNIDIPTGYCVCHKCDNPGCVNPKHLFIGTQQDNNMDRHLKGRDRGGINAPKPLQSFCKRGHEFTKENTYIRLGDNARVCRLCKRHHSKLEYIRYKNKK